MRAPAFEPRTAKGVRGRRGGANENRRLKAERQPIAKIASPGLEIGKITEVVFQRRHMRIERGARARADRTSAK